jgi:hypothetical protein
MTDDILDPEERDLPLEPRLADAARAYNPPPSTPREAMWARIEAARRQAGGAPVAPIAAPAALASDTKVIPIDAARGRRSHVRTWIVLAGTLAAGIAIGVVGTRGGSDTQSVANTPPAAIDSMRGDSGTTPATSTATLRAPSTQHVATTPKARDEDGPRPIAPPRPVGPGNIPPRSEERAPQYASRYPERASSGAGSLYHAAAVQTLSQAEALLVAWRVDAPRDTAAARQLGAWARDVLGSTRLLLDSPAASDPRLRELLNDLELVLAQIVQLSGAPLTEEERALLERSVRARDLLPRIRSAVPAGSTGAATTI